MKREVVLLGLGIFLLVFMIEGVSADLKTWSAVNQVYSWDSYKLNISNNDDFSNNYYNYSNRFFNLNSDIYCEFIQNDKIEWHNCSIYIELSNPRVPNINFSDDSLFPINLPTSASYLSGYPYSFWVHDKNTNENYFGYFNGNSNLEKIGYNGIINSISGSFYLKKDSNINAQEINGNMFIHLIQFDFNLDRTQSDISMFGIVNDNNQTNDNYNQRISALESWKQTISNTITSILNTLTGHNTRISTLENSTSNGTTIINNTTIIMNNGTNPYLKYLSNTDRKNMVCGYAEDNHLTTYNDLGWNCVITYKARGNPSCKCKSL